MEIATRLVMADGPAMNTELATLVPVSMLTEMRPERIGHRLMLLRTALGLKPSEISDVLGIQRTYWSRFESGNRRVSEHVAALLVDRFGVSLDFLILGRWDRLPLELAQKMRSVEAELSKNN